MRIIIKAVPERQDFIDYLKQNLPTAEFCMDEKQCAFDTFNRSLEMAGDDPCIHMEEDIILTKDFESKAQAVIPAPRPSQAQQPLANGVLPSVHRVAAVDGGRRTRRTRCIACPQPRARENC